MRMSSTDTGLSPNARLALWESAWRIAGLGAAVTINLAWIGLLAYWLVKLL